MAKAEAQAREAQIEATLERIRAASMAMQHSDELPNVALQFLTQLEHLDIPIIGSTINIVNEEKDTAICYFADNSSTQNEVKLLTTKEFTFSKYWLTRTVTNRIDKGEKAFTVEAKGVQIRSWIKWIREALSEERAVRLEKAKFKKVYFHSIEIYKNYSMTFSSVLPLNEEHWNTIQRMANTFILSYRRFLDLKKAEAQAREAQIEAALERVRSASMAMHKSDELPTVAEVLVNQMVELGLEDIGFGITTFVDEAQNRFIVYSADPGLHERNRVLTKTAVLESTATNVSQLFLDNIAKGKRDFTIEGGREIVEDIINFRQSFTHTSTASAVKILDLDKVYQHFSLFHDYSNLVIITTEPLSKEFQAITRRFADVFGQSYVRFLDLAKAEAQAREAQIEAALERIRAASMAMHKSEELPNVALVLVEQLNQLEVEQLGSSIVEVDEERERYNQYSAHDNLEDEGKFLNIIRDFDLTPIFFGKEILRRTKAGEKDFTIELRGKNLQEWMQYVKDKIHKDRGERMIKAGFEYVYFHFATFHDLSSVVISTLVPLPEADRKILRRMANTFGLSYRRYLDLIRVEQQAKEAEIEAALERVRSASLVMHHSSELRDVVKVTFDQLIQLGLKVEICLVDIFKEGSNDMHAWAASPQQLYDQIFHIPSFNHLYFRKLKTAKKQAPSFFSYSLNKAQKKSWLNHLLTNTEIGKRIKKDRKKVVLKATVMNGSEAVQKHHGLLAYNFEDHPYSEHENDIILRMSQVFEQAYVRFLDLQKAEAQAREAQIEAALERVRSRTMAMHNSKELAEAAAVLFEQLRGLGGKLWSCGFVLCEKDNPIDEQWMSIPEAGMLPPQYIPHEEDPTHHNMYKAWLRREPIYIEEVSGERNESIIQFLMSIPSVMMNLEGLLQIGFKPPAYQKLHAVSFSKGYLLIITLEDYIETDIFLRFAKVFDQTYTRFLDLQKAEAQAREAQIEAALERIRAQAMAMQSSQDLGTVAENVFTELERLGISTIRCGIGIINKDSRCVDMWTTTTNRNQ